MNSVIYSNPFLINDYEHQYRVTISNDVFTFDYVKCNEDNDDLDMCVLLEKTYLEIPIEEAKKMIEDKIDFRNMEKIKENANDTDLSSEEKSLENSCIITINELYTYLVDNFFN